MFLAMIALVSMGQAAPQPSESPAVRARGNLGEFVYAEDYPLEAMYNEEEGTVRFRLAVGADGRVTDCVVTSSSLSASLDETTCQIMLERARLQPARGSDGRSTEDVMDARFTWSIVSIDPVSRRRANARSAGARRREETAAHRARPVEPLNSLVSAEDVAHEAANGPLRGITEFLLSIDQGGRVTGCKVTITSGSQVLDETTCRLMRDRARFIPARDAEGRAVTVEVWGHVHWGGARHPALSFAPRAATSTPLPGRAGANRASYIANDD